MHDAAKKRLRFRQYEEWRENPDLLICSICTGKMDIVLSNVPFAQTVRLVKSVLEVEKSQSNGNLSAIVTAVSKYFLALITPIKYHSRP